VRLTKDISYAADPAAVFAMLTEVPFQERKCAATGALSHDVDIERYDDGSVVIRTRRTLPTEQVPDFAQRFVGRTIDVVQVDDWGPAGADGAREGTVVVELKGAPIRFAGSVSLRPGGEGTVEAFDGDIKASVPLIGGRMEKALEPALRAAINTEHREGQAWLAAR
jgi:hypothetical protein